LIDDFQGFGTSGGEELGNKAGFRGSRVESQVVIAARRAARAYYGK
jgi:hypothetical protein